MQFYSNYHYLLAKTQHNTPCFKLCEFTVSVIKIELNFSALTDEERHERKMYSAALYQKYLNRSGPKHLGTKEMPEVIEIYPIL